MFNSLRLVSMTKRHFWSVFKASWTEAFTEANNISAFKKTGVWPLNSTKVISTITEELTIESPVVQKTPITSKAIRRTQR